MLRVKPVAFGFTLNHHFMIWHMQSAFQYI